MKISVAPYQGEGQTLTPAPKFLTGLGLVARTVRLIRLGLLLKVARDVADLALLKLGKLPLKVYVDGHLISGCFRHRSFLHHIATGNYEPFTAELFKQHLQPDMTVVDGGAHVGFYTLLAARLIGQNGRVYSFEPDPHNVRCLALNVERNGYHNVTVLQKSLADQVGSSILYQSSGTISSSLGDRNESRNFFAGISVKEIAVQSTTLDAELNGRPVDMIKLDIEGAEPLALRGMCQTLSGSRPLVLFVEMNPSALHSLGSSPEAFLKQLRSLAFDVFFIDETNKKLLPLTEQSTMSKGNLYCKRGG